MIRKVLICTAAGALAVGVACSKSTTNPAAPTSTTQTATGANADGSTLKAPAPATISPTGGGQVTDPLTLTAGAVSAKYGSVPLQYRFQVRSGSTVVAESPVSSSLTYQPTGLNPDTDYTWRVQATYQGANGPWSGDASFRTPVGAYIHPGEVRDPLTIGKTVGEPFGVTFTSQGASIDAQTSMIRYAVGATLTSGEFSFLATNIKNAAPGGKSKMMAMQQGTADITDNPYRFTIEKRGSGYSTPGQTRYRIITGNATSRVFDSGSVNPNYDTSKWYFWQATWSPGTSRLIVRQDSETGPIIVNVSAATGSQPYAPNPMYAYVGAPVGRAGPDDASVPRIVVKNVWISANPRPAFPQ